MRGIAEFRAVVEREIGSVDCLVLFGSQASGQPRPDSDVDLMVVSRAFQGSSYIRRAARLRRLWKLHKPVDFLCFTPEEFEALQSQASIVRVALDEGIAV